MSRLLENDKSTREMASEYSLRAIVEQAGMTILLLLGANRIDLLNFKVLLYACTHLIITVHMNINDAM